MIQYTIYDHPDDYPEHFVVRRRWIGPGPGGIKLEPQGWLCKSLESARAVIPNDLYRIPRDPSDPPAVVETWL